MQTRKYFPVPDAAGSGVGDEAYVPVSAGAGAEVGIDRIGPGSAGSGATEIKGGRSADSFAAGTGEGFGDIDNTGVLPVVSASVGVSFFTLAVSVAFKPLAAGCPPEQEVSRRSNANRRTGNGLGSTLANSFSVVLTVIIT
jgi:hypothetical protein